MWRDVVNVKRLLREMQSTTKADLGKIRCEIAGALGERPQTAFVVECLQLPAAAIPACMLAAA